MEIKNSKITDDSILITLEGINEQDFQIGTDDTKGRYVYTNKSYKQGQIILEYKGNLLSYKDGLAKNKAYDSSNVGSYMVEFYCNNVRYFIDATEDDGSLGRLLSHSRDPNLLMRSTKLNKVPRLYFIAKKDIKKGEELSWDYGDRRPSMLKMYPWLDSVQRGTDNTGSIPSVRPLREKRPKSWDLTEVKMKGPRRFSDVRLSPKMDLKVILPKVPVEPFTSMTPTRTASSSTKRKRTDSISDVRNTKLREYTSNMQNSGDSDQTHNKENHEEMGHNGSILATAEHCGDTPDKGDSDQTHNEENHEEMGHNGSILHTAGHCGDTPDKINVSQSNCSACPDLMNQLKSVESKLRESSTRLTEETGKHLLQALNNLIGQLGNEKNTKKLEYGAEADGRIYISEDLWIPKIDYLRRYDFEEPISFVTFALELFYSSEDLVKKTIKKDQIEESNIAPSIKIAVSTLYDDWLQQRGYAREANAFMKSKLKKFIQRVIQNAKSRRKYQTTPKQRKTTRKTIIMSDPLHDSSDSEST